MNSTCYLGNDINTFHEQWRNAYGFVHREDGPAIIYKAGGESWYLNGIYYHVSTMPLNLFLAYVKWELKKNGS
jgi:hypothetical protein